MTQRAFQAKPTGPNGCQASAVAQVNACKGEAVATRRTSANVVLRFCEKHDLDFGDIVGAKVSSDEPHDYSRDYSETRPTY